MRCGWRKRQIAYLINDQQLVLVDLFEPGLQYIFSSRLFQHGQQGGC